MAVPIDKNLSQGANQATDPEGIEAILPHGRIRAHFLNQFSIFPFRHIHPSGASMSRFPISSRGPALDFSSLPGYN